MRTTAANNLNHKPDPRPGRIPGAPPAPRPTPRRKPGKRIGELAAAASAVVAALTLVYGVLQWLAPDPPSPETPPPSPTPTSVSTPTSAGPSSSTAAGGSASTTDVSGAGQGTVTRVQLPDLTGMAYPDVDGLLRDLGLQGRLTNKEISARYGYVVAGQGVAAGEVAAGAIVPYTVNALPVAVDLTRSPVGGMAASLCQNGKATIERAWSGTNVRTATYTITGNGSKPNPVTSRPTTTDDYSGKTSGTLERTVTCAAQTDTTYTLTITASGPNGDERSTKQTITISKPPVLEPAGR